MATPLTDGINALTAYANEVTGASDTTLSDAVETLVAGYGGGGSSSASSLPDLSDVTITSATNGQVLRYNGTAWINTNTPWAEMTAVASENLFDKNDITTGGGLLPYSGEVMEYEGMFYSYIPCESGTYTFLTPSWFYSDNTGIIPIYNSSNEYIGTVTGTTTESSISNHSLVTITISSTEINAGCTYFGFTENIYLLDSLMVVKGTTYPSSYIAFGTMNMIEGLQISKSQIIDLDEINNPLYGKIASFNGDSICAGAGFTGGYASIIGQENNMIIDNIAVSGATITPQANIAHIISTSINNMRADADYIILEGGVNDADMHITLGSITNGYTDTLDTTTFAGAFENMLKSAISRYHGKKIGYIFIHKASNNFDSRTTGSYYNVAKEACEKWGIPYLDLNNAIPPLQMIDSLKTAYTSNGDGYHPNEDGYKLYYVPKITAWMKTL